MPNLTEGGFANHEDYLAAKNWTLASYNAQQIRQDKLKDVPEDCHPYFDCLDDIRGLTTSGKVSFIRARLQEFNKIEEESSVGQMSDYLPNGDPALIAARKEYIQAKIKDHNAQMDAKQKDAEAAMRKKFGI